MTQLMHDGRKPRPSILTTFRPIEDYWGTLNHQGPTGSGLDDRLNPLDAFLIHLILEFAPGLPALVDLASEGLQGASSLIGLNHPHVRRVVAATGLDTAGASKGLASLRRHLRGCPGVAPLDVVPRTALAAELADQSGLIFLADARQEASNSLADTVREWLDDRPDALTLVLRLGRVGDCPAIEDLLGLAAGHSEFRLVLGRELEESLAASDLGVVARRDHPFAADVLERIRLLHAGNHRQLDLLKAVNRAAMLEAKVDDEVARSHPSFGPLRDEIARHQHDADAAQARADQASHALAAAHDQIHALTVALHAEQRANLLGRVRRRLARTPAGQVWRQAKRTLRGH